MRLSNYNTRMSIAEQQIPVSEHEARALAAAYKALGDETRLRMLALLLTVDELCVCKFEDLLHINQSKASRHLRYLTHAGLVEGRRDAVWVHYRIADDLSPALRALTESVRRAAGDPELKRMRALIDSLPGEGADAVGCAETESQ